MAYRRSKSTRYVKSRRTRRSFANKQGYNRRRRSKKYNAFSRRKYR